MIPEITSRMRTHRMWNAIRHALEFTRQFSETFAIAFIDVSGRTRMLWRESSAKPNGLAMAEKGAWTCLLSSPEGESINPIEFRKQESRQASVSEHFRLELLSSSNTPGCHGYPMIVNGVTVGFFGVSGVAPSQLEPLVAVIREAYISPGDVKHDHQNFDVSGF